MKRNGLTKYKNAGKCRELKGKVNYYIVFVNEPGYIWTDDERAKCREKINEVSGYLTKEAKKSGVFLSFVKTFENFTIEKRCEVKDEKELIRSFAREHGCGSAEEFNARNIVKYNAPQQIYSFLFKSPGRAHASPDIYASGTPEQPLESLYLYYASCRSLLHETMHLFGAADLFLPELVKCLADIVCPKSVMLDSENTEIDDLTRYLIGWTSVPSKDAEKLLFAESVLTNEQFIEAQRRQWDSDHIVMNYGDQLYSGPLKNGVKSGRGTYIYSNGEVYTGDFSDNSCHGSGAYIHSNGDVYSGRYVNGKRDIKGTYIYSSGDVYSGCYIDGKRDKEGTYIFSNGGVYSGEFDGPVIHGNGTYLFTNGSIYKGGFVNGEYHGKGTLLYSDGSLYTGGFANGKYHGKGKKIYADGTVEEGEFRDGVLIEK